MPTESAPTSVLLSALAPPKVADQIAYSGLKPMSLIATAIQKPIDVV
jgi:hypothetical protein